MGIEDVPERDTVLALSVLREPIFEPVGSSIVSKAFGSLRRCTRYVLLRYKPPLRIVRARIAPMLALMYAPQPDPEEGVGEPSRARRIRERPVNDEHGEDAKKEVETKRIEAPKGVERPDDAVVVRVEEVDVLLQHRLVRVLIAPACGALW